MIRSTPGLALPVVVGATGPIIHVISYPQWLLIEGADNDPEILFGVVAHGQPAEFVATFATRVAELLERHGLTDTPDTIRGAEV